MNCCMNCRHGLPLQGRYWSANVDDISCDPWVWQMCVLCQVASVVKTERQIYQAKNITSGSPVPDPGSFTLSYLPSSLPRLLKLMSSRSRVRSSTKELASRLRLRQASLQSTESCPFQNLNEQRAPQCFA